LGLGSCSALAGIYTIPDILTYRKRLAKIARFFCYVTQEVIVTDKDKEKMWDEIKDKLREAQNGAPPYSLGELLKLIEMVQDRDPEAGDAIALLIKRHFQRRRVLWRPGERMRLESLWKLELSKDQWGELQPLNYERDVAPLPLLETIEIAGDFPLLETPKLMRKDMRNRIVRGGAQGRNLDSKEVEREYRLKEFGEEDNSHEIQPNFSKWNDKEKFFERADKYRNPEYDLQYTTDASPGWGPYPWDATWGENGISDEYKKLWEVLNKIIQPLDEIDKALLYNLAGQITIVQLSRELGVPEGTLRSRKSRLITKLRKDATKADSSSVSYVGMRVPPKQGKRPPNIGP